LPAPDAESLMRSRYSAYVLGLNAYLLATWHDSTRPTAESLTANKGLRWLGLDILNSKTSGPNRAQVEFIAKYKDGGFPAQRLHEYSDFLFENGRWFYLSGTFR
jgi:SEC-C motif-containing protein